MIDHHAEYFREWLATFRGELFVILGVYADESFTNKAETLCGFIAPKDYWKRFSRRWRSVLNDFGAPYFHFKEFADKENKHKNDKNPFLAPSWNFEKRDRFLHELTIVLSEEAVPLGGVLGTKNIPDNITDGEVRELLIAQFYSHFSHQLNSHWRGFNGSALFVFDETENKEWRATLENIHARAQGLDARIGGLSYENDIRCPPLQAADLFAYICRQNTEKYYAQDKTKQYKRTLDWILSRNSYARFKSIHTKDSWGKLVRTVLAHRKQMKKIWAAAGDTKRPYIPEIDFKEEAEKLGLKVIDADKV